MMMKNLSQDIKNCTKCPLCETRINPVLGTGDINSDIMFIGEAPGQNEDEQGEPFVGRSGKLLDTYLESIGLSRSDIYIANIVKCRPPENRDPSQLERKTCMPYLEEQIKIIKPKLIVCLGRIAAQKLIRADYKIMLEHGEWIEKKGILYTATLHPAAILRNPNNKSLAFEDFLKIKDKLRELSNM